MPAARSISTLTLGLVLVAWPTRDASVRAADDVPNLAGTWTWSWKDPAGVTHRHVLEVEGLGAKLAARERFDTLEPVPVRDLRLEGKTIRFSVIRGDRRADYEGVVADRDTINGTVTVTTKGESSEEDTWEATRRKPKPDEANQP